LACGEITSTASFNPVPLNGSAGWTWGLEGELDFAPGSPVPTNLEMTGMGRVVRLNNPAALRPLLHDHLGNPNPSGTVPPVVSTVKSITGKVGTAPVDQTFTTGDPLIGLPVNFGPDTYFAGNAGNAVPLAGAEEHWTAGEEPLGLFQLRLGTSFTPPAIYFRGSSQVGAPGSGTTGVNHHTRSPDSRPISHIPAGFPDATQEFTDFGLDDPPVFINKRLDALVALCESARCRRQNLLAYFGEAAQPCGNCDICLEAPRWWRALLSLAHWPRN